MTESGTATDNAASPPSLAEALAALTDLMRRGRVADADTQIATLIAISRGGGREAVLAAVVADPEVNGALAALEQWLDGTVDAPSAVRLGAWWALPAAGLDLRTVTSEARLYIDAYPREGRVIGDLEERAADWLVRRIALSFDPGPQLPAMREAIAMLAEAARPAFPTTSASLDEIVTAVDDATLWHGLILQIVHSEMQRTP